MAGHGPAPHMTPEQFLDRVGKKSPESVYLFLGPESYNRERCRKALIEAALGPDLSPEDREAAFTRHDLDQIPLASAIDDARSMSLFATKRVIWLGCAESALPRERRSKLRRMETARRVPAGPSRRWNRICAVPRPAL